MPLSTFHPGSYPPPPPPPPLAGTYRRKYGILKLNWLYLFPLSPGKVPCSSNNKEQTQRMEVLTAKGKFWMIIVKSMSNE